MKTKFALLLCCVVFCSLAVAISSEAQSPNRNAANTTHPSKKIPQPDIFLVTIDTLRADHVECYGYTHIKTPALNALAKDGIRFTQAFTPSPITNTSHTSILTGLLPSHHGVTDFAVPLSPSHTTWAELLHQQGYHTAAFIGAVILDSKTLAPGLDRGFDFYDNFPEHALGKSRWGRVERRGVDVVHHAENWLNSHPTGPRFVWVHLYDPHDPYEPPPPYSQLYKDHLYDGEIAYADSALASFVAYLKLHGWYENALIVVVGDHGEGLGEHNEDTHGIFLYDSTTHVPLIFKLPLELNTSGTKIVDAVADKPVRTIDILPTVLDLVNISRPSVQDGVSLKPCFVGAETPARTVFGETDYPLRFGWAPLRSVRAEGFKFIEAPRPELYDLQQDAGELENRYTAENVQAIKLSGMLSELHDKSSSSSSLPDPKDKIEEQNLLHKAMVASDDDRVAEAREALTRVLQLDPKSPTALRQLGELELHTEDYAKAAEHLKAAVEVRPEDATAAFYEGQALEKTKNFAGARDALESSLKLMPGQLQARLLLGRVYLKLKDTKAADDQFEAALLLQSDSVDAQLGVAMAQIAEGNFADAVVSLEPLAKAQSKNAEVFELLAQAYTGLGKTADAQKAKSHAQLLRTPK